MRTGKGAAMGDDMDTAQARRVETGNRFTEGCRALAAWYEAHPEIPAPSSTQFDVFVGSRAEFAALAAQLGGAEKVAVGDWFVLRKTFGGIHLDFNIARTEICERRVVGTQHVPKRVILAHEEELVEWDCHSVFSD